MREWYRDIVYGGTFLLTAFVAYLTWRGPVATDPPIVQSAASHPVGGLIVVAILFIIAGVLNSAPLLSRLLPAEKPKEFEAVKDTKELPYYNYDKLRRTDPKLEIRFIDDRKVSLSKEDYAYFEFVDHGQSEAKFACLENFQIGGLGYRVKILRFGYEIQPDHSSPSIYFEMQKADSQPKLDIFDAFHAEWEALKRPQLDTLKIQLRASYQDGARNLFESRCYLVFYPGLYFRNETPLKIEKQQWRRVSAAMSPINWEED